jgi:hypothetical protein
MVQQVHGDWLYVDSVGTPAKTKSGIFAGNNISIFNPLHMKRVDAIVGFLGD